MPTRQVGEVGLEFRSSRFKRRDRATNAFFGKDDLKDEVDRKHA